jgi:hypothetical protein
VSVETVAACGAGGFSGANIVLGTSQVRGSVKELRLGLGGV